MSLTTNTYKEILVMKCHSLSGREKHILSERINNKTLEAIASETSLISKLIDYNDDLTKLLQVLQEKFLGRNGGDKISELIAKINDDVKVINELNIKFNDVMKDFDNS